MYMSRKLCIVILASFMACSYSSFSQKIVQVALPDPCSSVNIQEITPPSQLDFNTYPNPNDGKFTIKLLNPSSGKLKFNLQIVDVLGKVKINSEAEFINGGYVFTGIKLTPGIYYILLQNEKQSAVKMFIVQ